MSDNVNLQSLFPKDFPQIMRDAVKLGAIISAFTLGVAIPFAAVGIGIRSLVHFG